MKTLVDCDFVFDILTRGPFPSDDTPSEPIEQHIATCADCQKLADALRPATNLFHEALSDDERKSLPEFRDDSLVVIRQSIVDAVFEQHTGRAERIERLCRKWLSPALVLIPVAAACLLMTLGTSLFSGAPNDSDESTSFDQLVTSIPAQCITPMSWNSEKANQANCAACHEIRPQPNTQSNSELTYHCCTVCHFSSIAERKAGHHHQPKKKIDLVQLSSACKTCHQ